MTPDIPVYSVSEIASAVRRTLQTAYGWVRVRGEISNFRRFDSGHLYFSLKDGRAQLRCAMFRGSAVGLRFLPADGLEVEADGELSFYEPQGNLQLVIERMAPSGAGALLKAFEDLKRRLADEGLFALDRKKPLPRFPGTIGVVTSKSGAAVRDVLRVLSDRWPAARVVLVPVQVQGEPASGTIVRGLQRLDRWGEADVILLTRGGGSLEDLWAFNEEPVARAIASLRTPVVSAVGHESDTTIADLVADVRAPTPTAGAQLVVPDRAEVLADFAAREERMSRALRGRIQEARNRLTAIVGAYGFRKPDEFLRREEQRLDDLATRLRRAGDEVLTSGRRSSGDLAHRLAAHHPRARLENAAALVSGLGGRLERGVRVQCAHRSQRLAGTRRALDALDPGRVLGRGYSLARIPDTGRVVASAGELSEGDALLVEFRDGRARTQVETVETDPPVESATGGEKHGDG